MSTFTGFKQTDIEKMGEAQRVVTRALLPLLESGVHPLILVFALTRALRVILRKAPANDQAEVRPILFAYIEGRTQQPAGGSALWTPDSTQH